MLWLSTLNPVLSPQAFTRIELLVVIAIVSVPVALSVQTVRKVRTARTNNRKPTGLALQRVHAQNGPLPRAFRQTLADDAGDVGRR